MTEIGLQVNNLWWSLASELTVQEGRRMETHEQWTRVVGSLYTYAHILSTVFSASNRLVYLLPEKS